MLDNNSSIPTINNALRNKTISAVELVQSYIERIKQYDATYNSLITPTFDLAIDQAKLLDKSIAKNETPSVLAGIPIIHKDLFCTKDIKTSCASKMLDNFIAPYDATMVSKLEQEGCITLGKSNMDEFAMGSSSEHSFYGAIKNPWDTTKVPGGSSGGSAVAVAAGFAVAATGSDTGGSIRQPAAFCGISGLKPTYGRISRWGMISHASSLDTGGFFAKSAEDIAYLLQATAGSDDKDTTCSHEATTDYVAELNKDELAITKIGIPTGFLADLSPSIAKIFEQFMEQVQKLGVKFVEIELSGLDNAIATYYVISCAEASSNLSRYDGVRFGYRDEGNADLLDFYCNNRSKGFGLEVKKRILSGTYVLSADYYDAYYMRALRLRRLVKDGFAKALNEVDAILMPTTLSTAFELGSKISNPVDMYLEDKFTVPVSLAGLPAISVPAGLDSGLPVGVQLVGSYFKEGHLLQLAHKLQQNTDWHKSSPTLTK